MSVLASSSFHASFIISTFLETDIHIKKTAVIFPKPKPFCNSVIWRAAKQLMELEIRTIETVNKHNIIPSYCVY